MQFDRVVTTPNILSEVSNLSGQIGGAGREQSTLQSFAQRDYAALLKSTLSAQMRPSLSCFPHLGLTDSGIMHLAARQLLGFDR